MLWAPAELAAARSPVPPSGIPALWHLGPALLAERQQASRGIEVQGCASKGREVPAPAALEAPFLGNRPPPRFPLCPLLGRWIFGACPRGPGWTDSLGFPSPHPPFGLSPGRTRVVPSSRGRGVPRVIVKAIRLLHFALLLPLNRWTLRARPRSSRRSGRVSFLSSRLATR